MKDFTNGKSITLVPPTKKPWCPLTDGYWTFNHSVTLNKNLRRKTWEDSTKLEKIILENSRLSQYQYIHDRDENDVLWKPDWDNIRLPKCHIFFAHDLQKYEARQNNFMETSTTVYFSEEAAATLLEKLNKGEIDFYTGKGCPV
jgi:hypothetical protein